MPYSLSEAEATEAAEDALLCDLAGLMDTYESLTPRAGLSIEQECRILDVDKAKEVFPFFSASDDSRLRYGSAVYPASVRLIEQLYYRTLESAPHDAVIAFTGGGPGSGKSSLIQSLVSALVYEGLMPWCIVDGTMADYGRTQSQIALARSKGFDVDIWFLFRNFQEAIRGFIQRASNIGRAVNLSRVAEKHWNSWGTILRLVDDQVLDVDAVRIYEMKKAVQHERAFVLADIEQVREAKAHFDLATMVEVAYAILETMKSQLSAQAYEQLAKR